MKFDKVLAQPEVDLRDFETFRAEKFPASDVQPWLDTPDYAERIANLLRNGEISESEAEQCEFWAREGYIVIPEMFSVDEIDEAWAQYEALIAAGQLQPQQDYGANSDGKPGRILNPHFKVAQFERMLKAESAQRLVSLLLGHAALPFQTIAGHVGSQQKPHSDSIHMTTYPQGFLVANWIAFEDISADSGPLEFYPGSHRLQYILSRECEIDLSEGRAGYSAYHAKYEPAVQELIRANHLKPSYFLARKGDVLFWHANLLHGGSPIANPDSSRRALVCHYFAEGCVCYHDYTGTPSHVTRLPMLLPDQFDERAYLAVNPDVAAAGANAYEHYSKHGYVEGRSVK